MINYSFNPNEEIARWTTEVYIKTHQNLGWWIAFTNPTAGPWKKIVALSDKGTFIEIHRFIREGERPDLILVNDKLKVVVIVEAKDGFEKLYNNTQMNKSIRVIKEVTDILVSSKNPVWASRLSYKVIPSFLWMITKPEEIAGQCKSIQSMFDDLRKTSDNLLNIVITSDRSGNLISNFMYKGKVYTDLNFSF